ncbi:MAG: FHA domain-containing protein [Sandaracinaceae bacterium]|nr:FHA domain-containing protein [Sandaracinaceae bacterium]
MATSRFCSECGSPLAQTCAVCGAERAPNHSFCIQCGHPAEGAPVAASASAPSPEAGRITASPAAPMIAHSPATAPKPVGPCIRIIDAHGQLGPRMEIDGDRTDLGRLEGELTLEDDPFLDARHARFERREGRYHVLDLDSVNGVFIRIKERTPLRDGDRILLGRQLLAYDTLHPSEATRAPMMLRGVLVFGSPAEAAYARLTRITTEGLGRDVFYLYRPETMLGRERGDLVFSDDAFLSRGHARISFDAASHQAYIEDLGSSNGTFLRVRGAQPLSDGDELRIGRHLFRFEAGSAAGDGAGTP